MSEFVKSVNVIGLHSQFDFSCDFQEGINVIYGRNGTGKTTLLHIIANVLNRDFVRFAALDFEQIRVEFSKGEALVIELEKIPKGDHYHCHIVVNGKRINEKEICSLQLERYLNRDARRFARDVDYEEIDISLEHTPEIPLSSAYFPAFRTAIDAWAITQEDDPRYPKRYRAEKTTFARSLFGQFVPSLDYPATSEIELDLNDRIGTAITNVSKADRTHFGNVPIRILEALAHSKEESISTDSIFHDIESLSEKFQAYPIQVESISANLSNSLKSLPNTQDSKYIAGLVLSAYKDALNQIVATQESSFSEIERYLGSVNMFLENKNLQITQVSQPIKSKLLRRTNSPSVVVQFDGENSRPTSMSKALSSGERQIVTLLYATTKMSKQDVVLVDEPEISLNVDWQRKILPEMVKQMPSKQLIVCTHSPIIGAKYRDSMIELKSSQTANTDKNMSDWESDSDIDIEG